MPKSDIKIADWMAHKATFVQMYVISIVTPSFIVEGKWIAAIRIRTEEYKDVVADLEKAGYDVLSIGQWPAI